MTITILPEGVGKDGVTYRAISGARQSEGKTVGEALDALVKQLNQEEAGTLVIVQNLQPDRFFTAQQQERLSELMTRWRSARDVNEALPAEEETELEQLIETELKAATSRALGVSQELKHQAQDGRTDPLEEVKVKGGPFDQIIGNSAALKDVLKSIERVAPTDVSVLLLGEAGVGKQLLAHAIHSASRRADQPFIRVACAAWPADLLEVELFGSETGASTGAKLQRKGLFELAHRGTLMLGDVDELGPGTQAKVLRVLQEGEFQRVGGFGSVEIDVRLITATNHDLLDEVEAGRFRQDLFYRLSVFPLTIPPLRQRREDIPLLVRHFVQQIGARMGRQFDEVPASVMRELEDYDWPGNVRELENLIERAVILSPGGILNLSELLTGTKSSADKSPSDPSLEAIERPGIVRALEEAERRGILSALGSNPRADELRKLGDQPVKNERGGSKVLDEEA